MPELLTLINEGGAVVRSQVSGYIQYVGYAQLIAIATRTDSVIRLEHRPGHYLATGRPLAIVWPQAAAPGVARALSKAHVTGPHRTLVQDPVFAIDQLVEIAIRALSSAVNDTFTALTCVDWLSAGLGLVSGRVLDEGVYRDSSGRVRLIEFDPSYARMVNRAFDKIRQSAPGMPAVLIRLIDSIGSIILDTTSPEQRTVLRRQADMVLRLAEESVTEPNDLEEIRFRYRRIPGEDAFEGSPAGGAEDRPALSAGPLASASRCRLGTWWSRRVSSSWCCCPWCWSWLSWCPRRLRWTSEPSSCFVLGARGGPRMTWSSWWWWARQAVRRRAPSPRVWL